MISPAQSLCYYSNPRVVFTGLVGLAISYALSVTDRLSGMVTSFTETEKQMVGVERAVQYIEDVPSEDTLCTKVRHEPRTLPQMVIFEMERSKSLEGFCHNNKQWHNRKIFF